MLFKKIFNLITIILSFKSFKTIIFRLAFIKDECCIFAFEEIKLLLGLYFQKFHVMLKSIIRDIIRKEKFRPFVSDKSKTNQRELDESDVKATKCLGLWSGFSTVMPINDIYNAKKGSKEEPVTLLRHT